MNLYLAEASSDWGPIFSGEQMTASSFGVAFRRAGGLAQQRSRKRAKHISMKMRVVGAIKT
jgi:hypothetical protein